MHEQLGNVASFNERWNGGAHVVAAACFYLHRFAICNQQPAPVMHAVVIRVGLCIIVSVYVVVVSSWQPRYLVQVLYLVIFVGISQALWH